MELLAEPLYDQESTGKDDRKSAQRAARSLAASVAKLHGAVPLPVAAQKLLAATENNDFKVPELVRIIESDPALTARLIRDVNAALIGRVRCASVTQAVTLLGSRALRVTALAASTVELFGQDEQPVARAVAEHASRCATLARVLSPHCGLPADEMYACAMLHDLGQLMLLRGDDLGYYELLAERFLSNDLHHAERERYGYDHALLAGNVLAAWKLPHPLPRVVAWHHQPARAYLAAGQIPRMVALVRVADRLSVLDSGATSARIEAELNGMSEEIDVLGFTQEAIPQLAEELVRESFDSGRPPAEPATRAIPPPCDDVPVSEASPAPKLDAASQPKQVGGRPARNGPPPLPEGAPALAADGPKAKHPVQLLATSAAPTAAIASTIPAEPSRRSRALAAEHSTGNGTPEAAVAPSAVAPNATAPNVEVMSLRAPDPPPGTPATSRARSHRLPATVLAVGIVFGVGTLAGRWTTVDLRSSWYYAGLALVVLLAAGIAAIYQTAKEKRRENLTVATGRAKRS